MAVRKVGNIWRMRIPRSPALRPRKRMRANTQPHRAERATEPTMLSTATYSELRYQRP
jgi:hypothetical protein